MRSGWLGWCRCTGAEGGGSGAFSRDFHAGQHRSQFVCQSCVVVIQNHLPQPGAGSEPGELAAEPAEGSGRTVEGREWMDMTTRDATTHQEVRHDEPPWPAHGPPAERTRRPANLPRVLLKRLRGEFARRLCAMSGVRAAGAVRCDWRGWCRRTALSADVQETSTPGSFDRSSSTRSASVRDRTTFLRLPPCRAGRSIRRPSAPNTGK